MHLPAERTPYDRLSANLIALVKHGEFALYRLS